MFQGSLQAILSGLESLADSKTVLGKPVATGSITLVPVISLKLGLGSGSFGGAGGVSVEPRAVIVIKENNDVSVYPLHRGEKAGELAEVIPELSRLVEEEYNGNM